MEAISMFGGQVVAWRKKHKEDPMIWVSYTSQRRFSYIKKDIFENTNKFAAVLLNRWLN